MCCRSSSLFVVGSPPPASLLFAFRPVSPNLTELAPKVSLEPRLGRACLYLLRNREFPYTPNEQVAIGPKSYSQRTEPLVDTDFPLRLHFNYSFLAA